LISWLPFQERDEPYEKPLKAYWMFLGYKDHKKIDNLSLDEFKKEKKKWITYGDVASNAEKIKDAKRIA
jgi:hypothetical protein